ncbi:MAG TPA: hypothetical protein VFL12_12480 [Thermoanaerobaculia bacterium]|nr:hypothetical protein [Thermoanaerobaculia bacterium]
MPAADVSLSIEPDPYVSSDHATICRVVARNDSAHTLDGRAVAFEAQAWERGEVVMRETGRFGGSIAAGDTAETRIGFNGVFTDVRIVASPDGARGKRAGSRRGAKSPTSSKTSRNSKSRASKPSRAQNAK